jgi:hypothetical protein
MRDFQPGDDVFMQHPHLVAEGIQITMDLLTETIELLTETIELLTDTMELPTDTMELPTDTIELLTDRRKALAHLGLELQNLRRQNVQSLLRSFQVGHPPLQAFYSRFNALAGHGCPLASVTSRLLRGGSSESDRQKHAGAGFRCAVRPGSGNWSDDDTIVWK